MTADPCRDCDLCARSAAMWEAAKTAPAMTVRDLCALLTGVRP